MTFPNISIIGTGNVAFHLARNLEQAGFNIKEVYGRSLKKAGSLASNLYVAKPVNGLDFSESDSSLFFLCVSDAAIQEVATQVVLPSNSLLVHCSGATSLDKIGSEEFDFGVFYPIQTFSKTKKISFKDVAICIEASSPESEDLLEKVAEKLKAKPYFMNSEQRLSLHLAAVFACNFSNYFYSVSQKILEEKGLPFGLLQNLVEETVAKAFEFGPGKVQTGPASRRDFQTMNEHRKLLEQHPNWDELYELVSNEIMKNI